MSKFAIHVTIAFAAIIVFQSCTRSTRTLPIRVSDQRQILVDSSEYGRIDIGIDDLKAGLRDIFAQVAQKTGPIDAEPIIMDYTPIIRQALYNTGYCSIQKLNINDRTVDIDVYFRTNQTQPALTIDAYLDGEITPAFSVVNQYYISVAK